MSEIAGRIDRPLSRLAIVFGAMRSGTTSLFANLSRHPEIAACRYKEPGFFSNDDVWPNGLRWYEGLWDWDARVHRVALEKSTNYSKLDVFPQTVERLHSVAPHVKLIYQMRNPLERIESHYTLELAKGWRHDPESLPIGRDRDVIETSLYAKQLAPYFERFPRENILLLRFEEFVTEPRAVLARVCRFLEVDERFEFHGAEQAHSSNAGRRPGEIGGLIYRHRWRIPFWNAIHRRLPPEAIARIRGLLSRSASSNVRLSERQRQLALAEISEDLRRLESEFGFDLSPWRLGPRSDPR